MSNPYPLEHLIRKDLPLHNITSKEDVRPFAGKWVVVMSNYFIITDQSTGELHYVVGKLDHSETDWSSGEKAINLQRIAKYEADYCVLTEKLINHEIVLCNPSKHYVAHVIKMRLLTHQEITDIKGFMNELYPVSKANTEYAPLGTFGWISTAKGLVGRGDDIFSS